MALPRMTRRVASLAASVALSAVVAAPATTTAQPLSVTPATTARFTVMPVWYSVAVHKSNATGSPVVARYRPRQAVVGTLSSSWSGWLRTSQGYVNLAVLSPSGKTPKNGYASTLKNLCPVPITFNTPHKVPPNYTPTTERYLNCDALKSLNALEAAYLKKFGHYAQIDLAYRSYAEQEYWFHKLGYPRAAKPGTSNHGWGLAIDFSETQGGGREFRWGGPGFNWLKATTASYGFESLFAYGTAGESYHWDFTG